MTAVSGQEEREEVRTKAGKPLTRTAIKQFTAQSMHELARFEGRVMLDTHVR